MATLTVGTGKQFASISAAVAAAKAGDTVAVSAGTYTDDFATVRVKLNLVSVGGLVTMTSSASTSPAKALLTLTTDATVDGFAFTNMRSADGTGAGILVQGGSVAIRRSLFTGNQNGVLAVANASTTVVIQQSEFARNGNNDGFSANVTAGAIRSLTVTGSYVHDAAGATEIRSRAVATVITGNRIADNAATSGTSIDLPAAGAVTLQGNTIEKGAAATSTAVIRYGSESQQAVSTLAVSGNTVVSDRSGAVLLLNQSRVTATVASNTTWNVATLATGPAAASGTVVATARPVVSTAALVVAAPAASVVPVTPATPTTGVLLGSAAPTPTATQGSTVALVQSPLAQNGQIILRVSETAWHGDAQFNVFVDGAQVGGTMVATALHGAGQSQTVTLAGAFAPGAHTVAVKLLNSLGDGTAGRTLTVDGMTFNGQDTHQTAVLKANGTALLSTAPTTRATAITVNLSEKAAGGDALALITIDGKVQGGIQTVTASHSGGATMGMNFLVDLAPGAHTASVTFLNGAAGSGRSLYVDAIDVAGQHYASAAATLATTGSSAFAFTVAPAPVANGALFPTVGAAADLIVLPR